MLVQTIFDQMMLHDNQLDLIQGGDDTRRGVTAVNMVQDWFEAVAARHKRVCQTISTLTTAANTESTVWPTALLRIDELWLLDAAGKQIRKLDPADDDGGHTPDMPWPLSGISASAPMAAGSPYGYYPTGPGGVILWDPLPDAIYTIRGYGLWAKDDYNDGRDTFLYPDTVALAIHPFAVLVLRSGLDRDQAAIRTLATAAFETAILGLKGATKVRPTGRYYKDVHET